MVNHRGADVHRHVFGGAREAQDSLNEVVDVAEAAGLAALSVDGERLAAKACIMKLEMTLPSLGSRRGP